MPKKLYRSRKDRIIAGVCGGLGEYLDIDPVLIRIAFILFVLAGGAGILAYIIFVIVIPEEKGKEIKIDRGKKIEEFSEDIEEKAKHLTKDNNTRDIFAIIIIFIGLVLLLNQLFPVHWFRWDIFIPVIIILIGAWLLFKKSE